MGCRPSRRSTGRVRDFHHKRKNNNSYSYLTDVSERRVVSDRLGKDYTTDPGSRKGKTAQSTKEFNNFSTTSKTYFKPGLRASKITLRLSTDGTTLEIEEYVIGPPSNASPGENALKQSEVRRASAPVLRFQESKGASFVHTVSKLSKPNDMHKRKITCISSENRCLETKLAPLASVEADSIGDEEEFIEESFLCNAHCEEDIDRTLRNPQSITTDLNENCESFIDHYNHCYERDTECRNSNSFCVNIDVHYNASDRVHLTETSSCSADDKLNKRAYTRNKPPGQRAEMLNRTLSPSLSSAYQLSADICRMKLDKQTVDPGDLAFSDHIAGYGVNEQTMKLTKECCQVVTSNCPLGDSGNKSQLLDLPFTDVSAANSERFITQPGDESAADDWMQTAHAPVMLKFQSNDIEDPEEKSIQMDDVDRYFMEMSSYASDCDDKSHSLTYTSANSDFVCSDEEEFLLPLCPCGDNYSMFIQDSDSVPCTCQSNFRNESVKY